jgi:hypothetical protein
VVQLSLIGVGNSRTLADLLSILARRWARSLGEGPHVGKAVRATGARFSVWGPRALSSSEQARVAAYFGAVVRRATMRASDSEGLAARKRLVAATIEADLVRAGWDAERAAAEAVRATGGSLGRAGAA